MSGFEVSGGVPLRGRVRVPGDKSISHRALLLAARAEGRSVIEGLSSGDDVRHTARAVTAMGAAVAGADVDGGLSLLAEPDHVIDVGNSGTGIRLLAGFCAALPWLTVLQGDESIARRPMDRVTEPLRRMGATVDGRRDGRYPPLVVRGDLLRPLDYRLPVASAQVKAAVLLAGLGADGETVVRESVPTRAHTEELLALAGADIDISEDGLTTRLRPSVLQPFRLRVPGDPSQAAFWVVAACITPGSEVAVTDVYVGRARADFLAVLARMGAEVELEHLDATTATIHARFSPHLHGTVVEGPEVPGLIDEIPILAVAAAVAEGVTEFRDAAELRVKETDRVVTTVALLAAMGARAEPTAAGLVVFGGRLRPGPVDSHGDHRIAMAGAVAALVAEGTTHLTGWDAVRTSYPGFEDDLRALRGET